MLFKKINFIVELLNLFYNNPSIDGLIYKNIFYAGEN
jgi:hypothetical protein